MGCGCSKGINADGVTGVVKILVNGVEIFSTKLDNDNIVIKMDNACFLSSLASEIQCNQAQTVRSASGNISVDNVYGPVSTMSGSVNIKTLVNGNISTMSGSVTIEERKMNE